MSSGHSRSRKGLILALLATPLAGCFSGFQPSLLTLHGLPKPVMLSRVDRIGGGAPLPAQKTGDFEGESVSMQSSSEDANYRYTYTKVDNVQVRTDAQIALAKAGPDGDIRITTMRAWARGWPAGVKNTVYLQGDVMSVGGGK